MKPETPQQNKVAVVTGGSSGIGAAAGQHLAKAGFDVVLGARRLDRLEKVAQSIGARALPLDVTDPASVEAFVSELDQVDVLVNNAGAALGTERVDGADFEKWQNMYQLNVMGVLRMVNALVPSLIASGDGHIIQIGSIAGFETYPGGAGYTASKHALRAMTRTLRLELVGQPVRVTEVAPGMVETEFSIVRFGGDRDKADKVYQGMDPLTADDIGDCIAWVATRPSHVNIDEIVVRPRDQATATLVHRRGES